MAIGYIPLPAFKAPGPLDFSGINEGLDVLGKSIERNRLLQEQKEIGKALGQQPSATSSSAPQYGAQPNRLLSQSSSPAQYGATNAREFLKQQEGYAPVAQWDRRQNSGGYGSKAAPGETFTPEKAEQYLTRDMQPVEAWIERNIPNASPEQKTALVSFGYNLGTDDLDRLKPDMLAGNWDRVADRMVTFNKALNNQTGQLEVVNGLTDRRNREAALVRGGGSSPANALLPQPQSSSSPNYGAGMDVALRQGNLGVAMDLANAQRQTENTAYDRSRQARLDQRQEGIDAQSAEARDIQIKQGREELAQTAQIKLASVAQRVSEMPEEQARAMWPKVLAVHPKIASTLQQYGVDPNDYKAGTSLIIAEARGLSPAKPSVHEVNGRLVQAQPDGTFKEVYAAPPKAKNLTVQEQKEVFEADEGVQAATNVVGALQKALQLNDQAYSGPMAQTRGYTTSLFGSDAGAATEELQNVVLQQVLDNLKATFGAAPTEGERQILVDIQGSVNKAPEVRRRVFENAIAAANRRLEFNKTKAGAIRGGEYFQPGYQPSAVPATQQQPPASPVAVSGGGAQPPTAAIEFLKANRTMEMMQQFDAKYGPGSARRILGQQ